MQDSPPIQAFVLHKNLHPENHPFGNTQKLIQKRKYKP